jgi:hypothetical protein
MSSPHRHHHLPTVPRLRASELKLAAGCWALRCDARCADAPKEASQPPLCCTSQPGNHYCPLLVSLCLAALSLPFSSLSYTPEIYLYAPTQHPYTSQCLPAALARERTRRRSSSSCPRTAKLRARRSKSYPVLSYSSLCAQIAQIRLHATNRRLLARNWTPPVAIDVPMATRPAQLLHNDH